MSPCRVIQSQLLQAFPVLCTLCIIRAGLGRALVVEEGARLGLPWVKCQVFGSSFSLGPHSKQERTHNRCLVLTDHVYRSFALSNSNWGMLD